MKLKLKDKRGISLIVLVITIIIMIILAAAIILSLSNAEIIGNAKEAVEGSDLSTAKNVAAIAQSEWELMDDTKRANWATENSKDATVKAYVEAALVNAGFKSNYSVNSKGEVTIAANSIIERVEQIKKEKGAMTNWDDITVKQKSEHGGNTYTNKGFIVDYNGETYIYVYDTDGAQNNNAYQFNYSVLHALSGMQPEIYESFDYPSKIIVEVPEGITYISGGSFKRQIYAVIFPESLHQFDGGVFYGPATNLKEIKINGTLTSISGSGIKEDNQVPSTCSVFYKNKKMTLSEFSGLFN